MTARPQREDQLIGSASSQDAWHARFGSDAWLAKERAPYVAADGTQTLSIEQVEAGTLAPHYLTAVDANGTRRGWTERVLAIEGHAVSPGDVFYGLPEDVLVVEDLRLGSTFQRRGDGALVCVATSHAARPRFGGLFRQAIRRRKRTRQAQRGSGPTTGQAGRGDPGSA